MSYFSDLSKYGYGDTSGQPEARNVGWLDLRHAFETGANDDEILEQIWQCCTISVVPTRGFHSCELCGAPGAIVAERNGRSLVLGSAQVRVFSDSGEIFAAPNLIYHYMAAHAYRPPARFIDAVKSGPRPPSPAYLDRLARLGLHWTATTSPESGSFSFKLVRTPAGLQKIIV